MQNLNTCHVLMHCFGQTEFAVDYANNIQGLLECFGGSSSYTCMTIYRGSFIKFAPYKKSMR